MFGGLRKTRGFTLVELIGVMAIAAILASALAPRVFDDIKRARQDKEAKTLATLRGNLETYILESKRIPGPALNAWSGALAQLSNLPQAKVSTNDRGYRRGYYVDPRFFTTTDTAFSGYTQQSGLTSPPVSPRIVLVSLLTGNAPAAPTTNAAFTAIWNQTSSATLLEGPDVRIERLNLSDAFHRVILANEHTAQAAYQLETGITTAIPASTLLTRYMLGRTRVSLFQDPFPTGSLDEVFIVAANHDYVYRSNSGNWSWQHP
jgi:prepilin-type N-terminal cleavage/methylation domain-containing protein